MRSRAVAACAAALVAVVSLAACLPGGDRPAATPRTSSPPVAGDYLTVGREELMALPTDGGPWEALVDVAREDPGEADLADQSSTHAGRLLASALAFARTGQESYRLTVEEALDALPTADLDGARVLSVSRQLAGYVIAADLVGYREPAFVAFVDTLRTYELGGHSRWRDLTSTSEDSASNWGAWALASRIAASRYVGDDEDVERAARVFRGWTGDREAYDGFRRTEAFDESFACRPREWVPVNPADCGDLSGALVEDISRSKGSWPDVDRKGLTYSWEALGGAVLSALLLEGAGHADVWEWGDRALLRAAQFLHRSGAYPPRYDVNQYIPWSVNRAYDVDLGPLEPAGYGRQYGYTDWLP